MPDAADSGQKIDGTFFAVSDGFDDDEARRYWHSRPPAERLAQVQIPRRIDYANLATGRLLRVIEVVDVAGRPGE